MSDLPPLLLETFPATIERYSDGTIKIVLSPELTTKMYNPISNEEMDELLFKEDFDNYVKKLENSSKSPKFCDDGTLSRMILVKLMNLGWLTRENVQSIIVTPPNNLEELPKSIRETIFTDKTIVLHSILDSIRNNIVLFNYVKDTLDTVDGCEHCLDMDGKQIYPYYGRAPVIFSGANVSQEGATIIPREECVPLKDLPSNFELDGEWHPYMACGTYTHCLSCGAYNKIRIGEMLIDAVKDHFALK